MPNLETIRGLIETQLAPDGFNLTGTLEHPDVEQLAQRWLPLIRFHEDERFHPVALSGLNRIPREVFAALPNAGQRDLEVTVGVPDISGVVVKRGFPPPVLSVPNPNGEGRNVLNDTDSTQLPFSQELVGKHARLTDGPGFKPSNSIFGSLQTVSGLAEPSDGDPRAVRHDVAVTAEFRMILESLVHALRIDALPSSSDYPKEHDSLWDVTSLVHMFFRETSLGANNQPNPFPVADQKSLLLRILEGDTSAPSEVPSGWGVAGKTLETARNCAVLEYQLVYAYNDYDRYEPWPANYHEGDDEVLCQIFDRRTLEQALETGGTTALLDVPPLHTITSVHLERQGADRIRDFDPISQNEVFVARGSHATYLTPGSHDFMSFGETFEEGLELTPTWIWIATLGAAPLLLGLLAAIGEHFRDSNDETSEGGIAAGNPFTSSSDVVASNRFTQVPVVVSPLSKDINVYQASSPATAEEDGRLGLLCYSGAIGGHSGSLGKTSPKYKRKTDRFFRKLANSGRSIG